MPINLKLIQCSDKHCTIFILKRLAQKIAKKRGERYSDVINHLRTRIRFSLLRGVLVALTGERGTKVIKSWKIMTCTL